MRHGVGYTIITILAILVLLTTSLPCLAAFPAAYVPDGPRPRLWLTTEHLSMLQQAKTLNTTEWQAFADETADLMIELHWNGPQEGIPFMALMYKLTNNQIYADRAFYLMDITPDEPENQNDSSHGNYGYLALGYDWLYSNAAMTPVRKAAYIAKMIHWSDYVWSTYNYDGIFGNAQDTDLVTETGVAHLMMGCALYGDSPSAGGLLDRAWWFWEHGQGEEPPDGIIRQWTHAQPIRRWVSDAIGGMFYSGWLYLQGTDAMGLSGYWITLRTACGYDINAIEPDLAPFWSNLIRTTIDLTDPPRLRVHHTGDWQDPNLISNQPYLYQLMAIATFEANEAGYSDWAALGRGYVDLIDSNHGNPFTEFFFTDPDLISMNPTTAGLPTQRLCRGRDMLFFRSGWGTSATWGFFSGQGGEPADHQEPDCGNFILWRNNDFLTKDCRIYGSTDMGVVFNNLSIQNSQTRGSALMSGFDAPASISRSHISEQTPRVAYAMMQADDQWDEDPNEWEAVRRVESYRRHFVYADPYVVVFDRLRTTDVGWVTYRLRSLTLPQLQGTTISQTSPNGQSRLLHRTLEPANCTFSLLDESVAWSGVFEDWEVPLDERKWQYQIQPPQSDQVNLLNVMQMGPSSMTDFDSLEHLTGNGISGVRIGNRVIVFNSEESLLDEITYRITTPQSTLYHFVADLTPGKYDLRINGILSGIVTVAMTDNTASFTTTVTTGPVTMTLTRSSVQGVPTLSTAGVCVICLLLSLLLTVHRNRPVIGDRVE